VKSLKYFFINYLLSFKVWEGAPLGMRRRDERLGRGVKCWDQTKDEGKAWDLCQRKVKSHLK
jgi:hypothetical protein